MNLVSMEQRENFIEHHQVEGAHWGVNHGPPYPLDRTASGNISRKQEKAAARLARKEEKREQKTKLKADKKAVKVLKKQKDVDLDKMSEEEKEALRSHVSKSKNIDLILKYSNAFTIDEIDAFRARFDAEKKLRDLKVTKLDQGMAFIKKAADYTDTTVKAIKSAKGAADMIKELKEAPDKAKKEAQKQSILKSGNLELILKNKSLFNANELQEIINKKNNESKLKDLKDEPKKQKDEAERKAILDTRDPEKVYENREKLTSDDIQNFVRRMQREDALKGLSDSAKKSRESKSESESSDSSSKSESASPKTDSKPKTDSTPAKPTKTEAEALVDMFKERYSERPIKSTKTSNLPLLDMLRGKSGASSAAFSRARSLRANGYTLDEISKKVGIPVSTLQEELNK